MAEMFQEGYERGDRFDAGERPAVKTHKHSRTENPRVRKLILFIHEFKESRDYSPCVREMGDAVGINSTSVVMYYLQKLRDSGVLDYNPMEARTVRLTKQGKGLVNGWLKFQKPYPLRRASDASISNSP